MADTTFVAGTPVVSIWLNAVNRAVYDLIKTTSGSVGAGLVGYSKVNTHPVNTVGEALNTLNTEMAKRPDVWSTPEQYGAVGNNIADDTTPIKNMVTAINAAGGGRILFTGKYFIAQTGLPNTVNIEFVDCDGLYLQFNKGSKLTIKGNFVHSSSLTATNFVFRRCKNVIIENIETDGQVSTGTKIGTEQGEHGLQFFGCKNVYMMNPRLHDHPNDGLYIDHEYSGSTITQRSENFVVQNLDSYNNGRQGMSVIGLFNGYFVNGTWRDTGNTGGFGSYSPGAGIDMEPNFDTEQCIGNIYYYNPTIKNNIGAIFVCTNLNSVSRPGLAETGNVNDVWVYNPTFKTGTTSTGIDQVIFVVQRGGIVGGCTDFRGSPGIAGRVTIVYSDYISSTTLRDHKVIGRDQVLLASKHASRSIEQQKVNIENCEFVCSNTVSNGGTIFIQLDCGGKWEDNRVYMPSAAYSTGSATRETVKLSNIFKPVGNTYDTNMVTGGQKFTVTYVGAGTPSYERYLFPAAFGA